MIYTGFWRRKQMLGSAVLPLNRLDNIEVSNSGLICVTLTAANRSDPVAYE